MRDARKRSRSSMRTSFTEGRKDASSDIMESSSFFSLSFSISSSVSFSLEKADSTRLARSLDLFHSPDFDQARFSVT